MEPPRSPKSFPLLARSSVKPLRSRGRGPDLRGLSPTVEQWKGRIPLQNYRVLLNGTIWTSKRPNHFPCLSAYRNCTTFYSFSCLVAIKLDMPGEIIALASIPQNKYLPPQNCFRYLAEDMSLFQLIDGNTSF